MNIKREITVRPLFIENGFTQAFARLNEGRSFNPNDLIMITPSLEGKTQRNYRAFYKESEISAYMPMILGISSTAQEFNKLVEDYWASIIIRVKRSGMKLDISFDLKDDKTPKDFEVLPEDEKYKVGFPSNITHYCYYRYCLATSQVANSYEIYLNNKTAKHIKAWIESEDEVRHHAYSKAAIKIQANMMFNQILTKENKLASEIREGILRYFEYGRITGVKYNDFAEGYSDVYKFDEMVDVDDHIVRLLDIHDKCPNTFIALCKDETLPVRTLIYKAMDKGVLKQPEGSSMILYGVDTIGNSTEEAIAFLRKNEGLLTEIKTKLS